MGKEKIGFIGAGNMANALIKGLIGSERYQAEQLTASDADWEKLKRLETDYGIKPSPSNRDVVAGCSVILLAVKPQVIRDVLKEVKTQIRDEHLIISIAAGIPIRLIASFVGRDIPIIRVMPNTPALILKGISALSGSKTVSSGHLSLARGIFDAVGSTVIVEEKMMDAVTALSGSGPGFIFRIMECFTEAGEELGFDRDTCLSLVIRTFVGAAQLAERSGQSITQLREMVSSPGGTTVAGLTFMEENGLHDAMKGGIKAAYRRSLELGKND